MKWYQKTWVIILFLIIFWPVGLVFMWKGNWNKIIKIIITVFIAMIVFVGCISGSNSTTVKSTSKQEIKTENQEEEVKPQVETDKKENEEVKPQVEEKKDSKIKAGTYKIGTDIPAGEYLVISNSMAYIECTSDSTGAFESIVFNDNLETGANSYVTLHDGEYFKMQRAEMYPVAEAPSIIPSDGIYKSGMYKVGKDIPAGEYKVINESMGYIEVDSDSRHSISSIISNQNLDADTYITVSDGQYLKLNRAKIEK